MPKIHRFAAVPLTLASVAAAIGFLACREHRDAAPAAGPAQAVTVAPPVAAPPIAAAPIAGAPAVAPAPPKPAPPVKAPAAPPADRAN